MNKIASLLLLLIMSAGCFAAPRTKAEAKAIADKLAAKIGTVVYSDAVSERKAPVLKAETQETEAYYVFDYGDNEGFIIVSGDDRMPAIVGYTDTGAFDEANMPIQLKDFLEAYTRTVTAVAEGDAKATENASSASNSTTVTPVAPLLGSIAWNQDSPYNLMCPTLSGQHCVTGCSATAAAQIMRYHKYPLNQVAISGYTTETRGISISAISASTAVDDQYDWDNMLPVYTSSATEQQQNAVAKLMYHVGMSMKMDYGLAATGGSGAYYDAVESAFATFGYDKSLLQSIYRSSYTYSEWREIILRELNAKRPISYNGQSSGGGHSFVCDGIDGDGLVHINWGWGGSCNGYFDVAILNPGDNSGIGASSTTDGYNGYNMMVIGITPKAKSGESKIPGGTAVSDWSKIQMTLSCGNTDGVMHYNSKYDYNNKLIVTVTNNGDKEFYDWSEIRQATSETLPESSNNNPYLYISLDAGETKNYEIYVTTGTSNTTFWAMKNSTSVMATKTFAVESVANPALKITKITSNASTNYDDRYEVKFGDYNLLIPPVKEDHVTYNVTISNTGGEYCGDGVYFGFYNPTDDNFSASLTTVDLPTGETTLTFTDNNLVYGKLAGIIVWTSSEISSFFTNNCVQYYQEVGQNYGRGLNNGYFCYAEGPTEQVAIADANRSDNDDCYYATLYLDHAVVIPDGVDAYTAQIKSNDEIVMTKITEGVIPAYTGVVLRMSNTGNYAFSATNTDITIGSDLQGVLVNTPTSSVSSTPYVLNIYNGSPTFVEYIADNLIANKAYLIFPSLAKKCIFRFADDVDAIHTATINNDDKRVYNLQGMAVSNPMKGLYIINGKKILMK